MSDYKLTRSRTGWDVAIGGLLVVLGLVILGNVVAVTRVSVQFLGWMLVVAGVVGLVAALLSLGSELSRASALGGAVSLVAGLMCLRHVEAAALTLTLIVGGLFLLTGLVRLVAAAASPEHRVPMLVGGTISTVLGLIVLLNLVEASYSLLGVLVGIQVVADGLVLMIAGRVSVVTGPAAASGSAQAGSA
jgi:membrane protein HdeD